MRVPKYRRNPDGRAFVEYRRKRHYLGQYNTPESRAQYKQFLARIMAEADQPEPLPIGRNPTLLELAVPYAEWAKEYHSEAAYSPVKTMVSQVLGLYADTPISEFGPRKILAWQQWLIQQNYARITINQRLGQLKRWLKWLVSRELIAPDVLAAANTVSGLRAGKSEAAEPEPVAPVAVADVNATLPFLPPPVAAMVQVQYLCGMRPQDVIRMRPQDIDRAGEIWIYKPETHKNTHRGQSLVKAIPRAAQAILLPFLDREPDAFCFDPRESSEWAYEQKRANSTRATKRYPSEEKRLAKQRAKTAKGKQHRAGHYKRYTYGQAIERACKAANVPHWTPLQLRHSIATLISQHIGEQAAQRWLGHARLSTTGIYVEKQRAELVVIAEQVDRITSAQPQ